MQIGQAARRCGPPTKVVVLVERLARGQDGQMTLSRLLVLILALTAIAAGGTSLYNASAGLIVTDLRVGETPVTVFRPSSGGDAPVVVIAHGFSGSQQLMQPFAVTLARNGYLAVTFDAVGHGRHPEPIRGDITEPGAVTDLLVGQMAAVAEAARRLPGADGRLAVIGHSMASDIVIRFAMAAPDVAATVAVSAFSPVASAESPRDLLVIVGSWEPAMLQEEGLRLLRLAAGPEARAGTTYGDPAKGQARRLELAPGVEHIGVLYSAASLSTTLHWLDSAFGRAGGGFIDARGVALALLMTGLIALAWPLTALLPRLAVPPETGAAPLAPFLALALLPAVGTPLILWKMPTAFLPALLADYLALHFLVYGLLTFVVLALLRARGRRLGWTWPAMVPLVAVILAILGYDLLGIGQMLDRAVFSFTPIAARWPLIAVLAFATLPCFIADEWLTRIAYPARGAYATTKACFVLSLAFAIVLAPAKLFFLAIIAPAILALFIAFGLISRWTFRATGHFLPGAVANAIVFAWGIGVTFPLIVR